MPEPTKETENATSEPSPEVTATIEKLLALAESDGAKPDQIAGFKASLQERSFEELTQLLTELEAEKAKRDAKAEAKAKAKFDAEVKAKNEEYKRNLEAAEAEARLKLENERAEDQRKA